MYLGNGIRGCLRSLRYLMKKIFVILVLILTSYATQKALADDAYRNISAIGPYGNMTVREFALDADGFCWMGLDDKLLRFDGSHLLEFPLPNTGERNIYVVGLEEINGEYILAATGSGLWKLAKNDPGKGPERVFEKEIGEVTAIMRTDEDNIAIGTSNGLKIYNTKSGLLNSISFAAQSFAPENKILAMTSDATSLYAVCGKGIVRIDRPAYRKKNLSADASVPDATSMVVAAGKIFVGSQSKGLLVYDKTTGKSIGNVDVGCNVVTSLSKGVGDKIYAGTDGNGVVEIDAATLKITRHFQKKGQSGGELSSGQVYAVKANGDDGLWIGYYQGGADYRLNVGNKFKIFSTDNFNSYGNTVRAVSINGDEVMLGTRNGLYYVKKNHATRHISMPRLRSDMVLAIHKKDGLYYIGSYGGGLMVYDPSTDRLMPLMSGGEAVLTGGHVFSIAEDKRGVLWFGTSEGVVAWQGSRILKKYDSSNSQLPDDNVFEIFIDSSGNGWIGTGKGLAMISPEGELRKNLFAQSAEHPRSNRYIYEDSKKNLYFVTENGRVGVCRTDMSDVHDVDPEMFQAARVKSMIEDDSGNMWVITDNSLYRWDKKTTATRFGYADGILNTAFISGRPVKDERGNIYIGNPEGLIFFNPDNVESPADNAGYIITGVYADEEENPLITIQKPDAIGRLSINLEHLPKTLRIDLSNFLYSKPESSSLEYSYDRKTWHKLNSEMSLVVYNLGYGTNKVWLRNTNNPAKETEIDISVPYPNWPWMCAVGIAILLLGGGVIFSRRIREKSESGNVSQPENIDVEDTEEMHPDQEPDAAPKEKRKYSSNKFLDSEKADIENRLSELMASEKPYLNPDLSVGDLAGQLGISSHRLSQYFSQHAGKSFYDYINGYRVEEFKSICATHADRYTLTAMSEKAGFSSRASFFRYFKKHEGITPAEYLKRVE